MQTKIEKLPKSVLKITITVETDKVKAAYEKILDEAVQKTNIPGFRPGNAPKKMVEEKIGVSNLYGDVVNELLQTFYPQALKENLIMPISNPRVEINEFDLEKEFIFTATVATRPEVKVGDYRKHIIETHKQRVEIRKKDNEEKLKKGEALDPNADHVHVGSSEIIDAIIKETTVEVADTLIDEETNRMMSRLVDQSQAIGLSLDQYLKAQKKTTEDLRKEYATIAERNLKAEFALSHLVQAEKVEVSDEEIDLTFRASGNPQVEEQMKNPLDRLYVKSILQKNKLITKLIEEVDPHTHSDVEKENGVTPEIKTQETVEPTKDTKEETGAKNPASEGAPEGASEEKNKETLQETQPKEATNE
jgi:FKBP-type peptidyl-prolyl cis-trans isomerase (trigger factor)